MTFDVETTTTHKGSPFTERNKLVTIQLKINDEPTQVFTPEQRTEMLSILQSATMLVATNAKFDLHWLRRCLGFTATCVWDCQIAEFLFSKQLWIYPDLDTMCLNYGIPQKLSVVKRDYWEKGIDTDQIPFNILAEYGAHDVEVTYKVFQKQLERFTQQEQDKFLLFRVQCNDLLVLQEMEYNGILYASEESLEAATKLVGQIEKIDYDVLHTYGMGIPLNLNSNDDKSILLYGGYKKIITKVPAGEFKTGARVGQVKYKNLESVYEFPRLVDPLKGSALAKDGYYSTDADTLVSLHGSAKVKRLIEKLLERAKLKKLQSTYLTGFPNLMEEQEWIDGMLHSNLNQCAVVTGRLSSTKPNQQNMPKEVKKFCVSRYS